MALRYVFDENLRGPLWAAICRANARRPEPIEITRVGDEADLPLRTTDPELLRWAEDHHCVVVSSDVRTMPVHHRAHLEAGRHCPGVFLIELPCSIPLIVEALLYYAEESDEDLWRDRIIFIP
jgi:Domain of unknown function (DUF5615)